MAHQCSNPHLCVGNIGSQSLEYLFQGLSLFLHRKDELKEQQQSFGFHQPTQKRQRAVRPRLESLLNTGQKVSVVPDSYRECI
jgi:hypothetical protein